MAANYDRAREAATLVLKQNSVIEPPVEIAEIALNYVSGIDYVQFSPPYDAIAGYIDFERDSIVINEDDSAERQRFTIAHELGHWLLHRKIVQNNPNLAVLMRRPIGIEKDPLEQEANCFAASLLVPAHFVRECNVSSDVIAKRFKVSREMAGFRLNSLKLERGQ